MTRVPAEAAGSIKSAAGATKLYSAVVNYRIQNLHAEKGGLLCQKYGEK